MSREEVITIIYSLPCKKSSGYDEITNDVLKHICNYIVDPLTHILNLSFSEGVFPDELKIAKVIPIYKSGSVDDLSNYRPVSILPAISKIFERLAYNRLSAFVNKSSLLYSGQYGFRKDHSTYMAALKVVDDIVCNLDNRISTVALFVDLSKAFDTINHNILERKLYIYGIRGVALSWIKSYLTNRKQYVRLEGKDSKFNNINMGVPQGSILGPLLFILYINDFYKTAKLLKFVLFADDTTVYCHNSDVTQALQVASMGLNNIADWLAANKLSLNINKTKLLVFDKIKGDTPQFTLRFKDTLITSSSSTKFLGVTIDNKLSWKEHITNVTKSVAKISGVMNRLKYYIPSQTLLTIYNALILPHLTYCILLWGNSLPVTCKLLSYQKRAVRAIAKTKSPYAHTRPLFHDYNLLTLKDHYKYQLGIFLYRHNNDQLPSDLVSFFQFNSCHHNYPTRGKDNLLQPLTNTVFAHSHVRSNGVSFWNSLNVNVRNAPNINIFTKYLKKLLLSSHVN